MAGIRDRVSGDTRFYEWAGARHIELVRIRTIPDQLSQYLKYEFLGYPLLVEAGEQVMTVKAQELQDLSEEYEGLGDFVLFDSCLAFVHDYGSDGVLRGAWRVDDRQLLEGYDRLGSLLVARSKPLQVRSTSRS
jgi:hypothetical protein